MDEEFSVYYKVSIDTYRSLALVYRKINHIQEAALVLRKNIYAWLLYSGFLAYYLNLITCVLILLREDTVRIYTERLLQPTEASLQPYNHIYFGFGYSVKRQSH